MSPVPGEIKASLTKHDNLDAIARHTFIDAAPGSSLGETCLVAVPGHLYVFVRQTKYSNYELIHLKPDNFPTIQLGSFGKDLHLPVVGQVIEPTISLKAHEEKEIAAVLAHAFPEVAEPSAASPTSAAPAVDKTPTLVQQTGEKARQIVTGRTEKAVEHALDVIEYVASRAAARDNLSTVKVSVNLNLMVGHVEIEVGYDAKDLRELKPQNTPPPAAPTTEA